MEETLYKLGAGIDSNIGQVMGNVKQDLCMLYVAGEIAIVSACCS
jgi:hypothetical protein